MIVSFIAYPSLTRVRARPVRLRLPPRPHASRTAAAAPTAPSRSPHRQTASVGPSPPGPVDHPPPVDNSVTRTS